MFRHVTTLLTRSKFALLTSSQQSTRSILGLDAEDQGPAASIKHIAGGHSKNYDPAQVEAYAKEARRRADKISANDIVDELDTQERSQMCYSMLENSISFLVTIGSSGVRGIDGNMLFAGSTDGSIYVYEIGTA